MEIAGTVMVEDRWRCRPTANKNEYHVHNYIYFLKLSLELYTTFLACTDDITIEQLYCKSREIQKIKFPAKQIQPTFF